MNFGDIVIEILAQNASFSPKREREREKKRNCGNGVAEIVGKMKKRKRIKTIELPKL